MRKPNVRKKEERPTEPPLNYGDRFIEDHWGADIDFYWAIKAHAELPKNRVLISLAQKLQRVMADFLRIGTLRHRYFMCGHNYEELMEICLKSPDEAVVVDNYERTYTGKQIVDIIRECVIK